MIRLIILLWLALMSLYCRVAAQSTTFPKDWLGNWKGELLWYKNDQKEPVKIPMELRIRPISSNRQFTWQIIYGDSSSDNRPYILRSEKPESGHWVIDEDNGIVLDQYWIAGRFCGAFTVGNSTIVNSYWMEKEKMIVEFYSISSKPLNTTGKGTEVSPSVDTYSIKSYQKGVLARQ